MSITGGVTYSVHQGRLGDDLLLPSSVLHRVGTALTPLRAAEEDKHRSEVTTVSRRASVPRAGLTGIQMSDNNVGDAHGARSAHPVKAAQFLVFLMKAEMFLILLLIGSSFSESDRTP